ncbi:sterile alpha and TIR motif-containing protein 1 isoform X2 [Drosophila subobscura]|uniref:sterile alpha and TIR motif-containing protein 1 isoform X2 n=1 Tax=Drosophila subobscura TaxID=7241 RepID=UPI00155AAA42|nr:sterile alpha and TIR motif-containing protein 1 isoform X2 [Drosophila subobscura]
MNSPQLVAQAHDSAESSGSNAGAMPMPMPMPATAGNKYAPGRRLAARQTLRLAIPKHQGDPLALPHALHAQPHAPHSHPHPHPQTGGIYRHSPSQLPPAPILKRAAGSSSIPKSASPLESHNLPNVTPHSGSGRIGYNVAGGCSSSGTSSGSNFLGVRKPSLTLNSSDIRNNNDLFAFPKDMSPALELNDHSHSPLFTDISSANSNGSPTHHHQLGRLFSLSPSSIRSYGNMTDFSDSSPSGVLSPASTLIENFHKKNSSPQPLSSSSNNSISSTPTTTMNGNGGGGVGSGVAAGVGSGSGTANGRQINTSSSSCSSLKETSHQSTSTSQQVVNSSSSTTTRVEKKSQRLHHHITSSSSSSSSTTQALSTSSEMKAAAVKRDLTNIQKSMSEINDLANSATATPTSAIMPTARLTAGTLKSPHPSIDDLRGLSQQDKITVLKNQLRASWENIVDNDDDDSNVIVTLPDDDDCPHNHFGSGLDLTHPTAAQLSASSGLSGSNKTIDTIKFQEKRMKTESKTKVVTDGYSSEQATSNSAESKRLQAGDIDYKENKAASAMRNRLEVDGVKTEENAAVIKEALSLRTGDITQQASNNVAAASIKVQSDTFSADKKAISQSQQSQTMTSNGIISQEKHVSSASQANYSMTHKGVSSSGSSMITSSSQMSAMNGQMLKLADLKLDDLKSLTSGSGQQEIEQTINKYSNVLTSFVSSLQDDESGSGSGTGSGSNGHAQPLNVGKEKTEYLEKINEVIRRAWAVPTHGHELGYSLCNSLRQSGGLDLLMKNCVHKDLTLQFSSAQLLEQCLTTENRKHVVDNGLDKVVNVACVCTKKSNMEHSRVGTGILEHLFKHSEGTCSDVIRLGGLDAVLFECRTSDVETLRHCASALANLSLYGGAENQEEMILRKVPMWLFPLAFHNDDNIKYYACLAIAVLVANKEIEAEVLKSGCLDLVEPFVTSHDPSAFARSNLAHAHGQSKHWLKRLVPVLSSNREEARNLAAFHFCMEAGIKREQGNTDIFREINAIEALKTVASCPNAIASKFAAQALRLIGETVPHKLSQQVPLWSVEDVQEWVKQIGFNGYIDRFEESQVDGDLLLKLNQDNLRDDIGIGNGILLRRFERELQNLKRMADYSSKDTAKMHQFLSEIGTDYCTYTYAMLNAGIDKCALPHVNEDMLMTECGIHNSIHRLRILNAVKNLENSLPSSSEENMAKTLDVFVSYRRSNGSQLASLLKVHLQLRGFSVFIDVERLEAGKFDNGLLNSIRQAKNFVLVLTPDALHRCIADEECKDWVHREIVAALQSNCNIIPIMDQHFDWPEVERLPEDMRSVAHFNGVSWIHDYQDACIDKLERFLRGEKNIDRIAAMVPGTPEAVSYRRMHSNDSDYQSGGVGGGASSSGGGGIGGGGGVGGGGGTAGSVVDGLMAANGSGQANHQANRYRQSPSPARQRGSTSQLSGYARHGKRSNILPPYRTQQAALLHKSGAGSASMQNMMPLAYLPPRRSSAAGLGHSAAGMGSGYRSHSVDGLLDQASASQSSLATPEQRIAAAAAMVTAGSTALTNASSTCTLQPEEYEEPTDTDTCDHVTRREKRLAPPANVQSHRKSRSLDHILSKQTLAELLPPSIEPTDETQSMQNLAMPMTPQPQRRDQSSSSKSPTPERPPQPHYSRQSPEGVSSTESEREDGQSLKVQSQGHGNQQRAAAHVHRGGSLNSNKTSNSSLGSNNSASNNKTIFNRTMKKVRSLIKKP